MHEELKIKLEEAYRILYMEGLAEDTIRGHITAKSDDHRIYIKPWGMGFEDVTAQDLLCVDIDGNLLERKGRLHSELPIHLEIYRKRKDLFSIIHVHPFHTVMFSSVFEGNMKIVGQNGMHFAEGIPFYESAELINLKEQGAELARLIGDGFVILMRNHGIVTAGRSIEEAAILAIDFEKAAREHLMVSPFKKVTEVPVDIATKMNAKLFNLDQYRMMWEFYLRKLSRRMPSLSTS